MNKISKDKEYLELVNDILDNEEFQLLKNYKHHGITRYDHCLRVSYWSYKLTKKLRLDYKSTARAGLLHDFFHVNNQELKLSNRLKIMVNHPYLALINARKHYDLNKLEENIILTHMFPINIIKIPTKVPSWIVNIVDDVASIYERLFGKKKMNYSYSSNSIL